MLVTVLRERGEVILTRSELADELMLNGCLSNRLAQRTGRFDLLVRPNVIASALMLWAFLSCSPAGAQSRALTKEDVAVVAQFSQRTNGLGDDILQAQRTLAMSGRSQQAACLGGLIDALTPMQFLVSHTIYRLIQLSTEMETPGDKIIVSEVLTSEVQMALELLPLTRQRVFAMGASCSVSALFNTYAQKTTDLLDAATAMLNGIIR
jgi:hypothetical protein